MHRRDDRADERPRACRRAGEARQRTAHSLQREADELASQQRSLLVDLRRLEVERDLKTEQLKQIDVDARKVALELGSIGNQIDALEEETAATGPILEARMVELYKLGGAGYVRLLFNASDLREFGRAYRMVAAVAAIDRRRADQHQQNLHAAARRARRARDTPGRDDQARRRGATARARRPSAPRGRARSSSPKSIDVAI